MGRPTSDSNRRASSPADQRASQAWAAMLELFSSRDHQERFAGAAREFGLTPASMKALMQVEPGGGVPMRSLADFLHCDASNVTQLVDALEQPGYVERVPSSEDRRVKLVRLTPAGVVAREQIIETLHTPPQRLTEALSARELADLVHLLEKVAAYPSADEQILAG